MLDLFSLIGMAATETEQKIKEETKATIRCIPLNNKLKKDLVYIVENLLLKQFYLQNLLNA